MLLIKWSLKWLSLISFFSIAVVALVVVGAVVVIAVSFHFKRSAALALCASAWVGYLYRWERACMCICVKVCACETTSCKSFSFPLYGVLNMLWHSAYIKQRHAYNEALEQSHTCRQNSSSSRLLLACKHTKSLTIYLFFVCLVSVDVVVAVLL